MTKSVLAPTGGFGNYVRFLVLLDDRHSETIKIKTDEESYRRLAGPDWPHYVNYLQDDLDGIGSSVLADMEQRIGPRPIIDFTSVEKKLAFAHDHLFPRSRTWHNWLTFEWQYRDILNSMVRFDHDMGPDIDAQDTMLLLTIDPHLAYHCYLKFNTGLNNMSPDIFLEDIHRSNHKFLSLADQFNDAHIMDSGRLWREDLDPEWYDQLCAVFGSTPNYPVAQEVHTLWYQGHKRAETEILEHLNERYGTKDK